MAHKTYSRREFIKMSSAVLGAGLLSACGGGGSSSIITTPGTTPGDGNNTGGGTAPPTGQIRIKPQNRALVYIMLSGGNDSFNMLIPNSAAAYTSYQRTRSNLAIPQARLLPLQGFTDSKAQSFALHPAMPKTQQLFNNKQLAFIANCGPLIEPVTKQAYMNNTANLPIGLMSHADQIRHWQTGNAGERVKHGWFGRYADVLQANKADTQLPMNISLSGSNIMQNGQKTFSYAIDKQGSSGLIVKEKDSRFSAEQQALNAALLTGFNTVLNRNYNNAFQQTYTAMTRHAQAYHEAFKSALAQVQVDTTFASSELSQQLKMAARSIAASSRMGMPQQTFFIEYLGWDHHDELLNNHQKMLGVLDNALSEFNTALQELNVADKTVTLVGSDFGRSLTSNGNGTDHGWGGNVMVMGNAVQGGKVFGDYPELTLESDLDVGGGVLIPTTSTDEIFAELSQWFGVEKADLTTLFPNLAKFYNPNSTQLPLGFLA